MQTSDDLKVHDLTVAETTSFNPSGNVEPVRRVTFFVGVHGPFIREYKGADGTHDHIQADIAKEVALLKSLHEFTANS